MGIGLRGEYTLTLDDREVYLKFGTNSTALFCEEKDIALSEFQERFSEDHISLMDLRDFIWAGAVAGCHTKGIDVDFDRMDVGDWIDDAPDGELERIIDIINESSEVESKNSQGPDAKKDTKN